MMSEIKGKVKAAVRRFNDEFKRNAVQLVVGQNRGTHHFVTEGFGGRRES